MMNWIRRNWLLLPVILLVGVMLIKGLGGLLPEFPQVSNNVIWSWITAKDNLYEKLLVGVALIIAGFVLKWLRNGNTKNLVFPKILINAGCVVIIAALFSTGTGELSESIVQKVDTAASCSANPNQEKCTKLKEEKAKAAAYKAAAENKHLATMARQQTTRVEVPVVPVGAPTQVIVPACGNGWAQVNIPAKWNITLAWNTAAAIYEWRSVITGEWMDSPDGGSDAVRFCAKHQPYAGESMPLTWSKM